MRPGLLGRISAAIEAAFERHKLVRRITLAWACWLISIVVLRVSDPGTIVQIGAAGASVVTAVLGILATVIGFYQWHRHHDDARRPDPDQ